MVVVVVVVPFSVESLLLSLSGFLAVRDKIKRSWVWGILLQCFEDFKKESNHNSCKLASAHK